MGLLELRKTVKEKSNKELGKFLQRFFKTGKGEYAEGDIFAGIKVPVSRKIAMQHLDLSLKDLQKLLKSKIHEQRLIALLILVEKYKKSDEKNKERIFNFYIENIESVNNWDLVDLSAEKIIGAYLFDKEKNLLYEFAKSENLWKRRIALLSSFYFIQNYHYSDTLKIIKILLNDEHDLIQKAAGWMLREIGKRDLITEEKFLKVNYKKMPRTMLRYAIEKFPEPKRQKYLKGLIK